MKILSVGILIFDEVDALNVAGLYQVFSTASRLNIRQTQFRCFLIAEKLRVIRSRDGLKLLPDSVLLPSPDVDIFIVPDGEITQIEKNREVIAWIGFQTREAIASAGIGAGRCLLAHAGDLSGHSRATYSALDQTASAQLHSACQVKKAAWFESGNLLAPVGTSLGIEIALDLVARVSAPELAEATFKEMGYIRNA